VLKIFAIDDLDQGRPARGAVLHAAAAFFTTNTKRTMAKRRPMDGFMSDIVSLRIRASGIDF
jgi:hypothetical protein